MYVDQSSANKTTLYQGDVIDSFPFILFENSQPVQKHEAGYFNPIDDSTESYLHVLESRKQNIMILSQTCDIQRRNNFIICPVYNLVEQITSRALTRKRVESLRARKIYYWFYLPSFQSFPESFADFQTMLYVPKDQSRDLVSQRVLSLGHLGRHHLAWFLANYFGRPIEENI